MTRKIILTGIVLTGIVASVMVLLTLSPMQQVEATPSGEWETETVVLEQMNLQPNAAVVLFETGAGFDFAKISANLRCTTTGGPSNVGDAGAGDDLPDGIIQAGFGFGNVIVGTSSIIDSISDDTGKRSKGNTCLFRDEGSHFGTAIILNNTSGAPIGIPNGAVISIAVRIQ